MYRGAALIVLVLSLFAVRRGTAELRRLEIPSDNIFNHVLTAGEQSWGVYGADGLCLGVIRSRLTYTPKIELSLNSLLRMEEGKLLRLNLAARFSTYRLLESLEGQIAAGERTISFSPERAGQVVVSEGTDRAPYVLPQPTILLERDGKPFLSLARSIARRFDPAAIRTAPLTDRVTILQCEDEAVRAPGLRSTVISQWLAAL